MSIRSPFFIVEECLSPSHCEGLIDDLGLLYPSRDEKGHPLKHERIMKSHAELFTSILDPHLPLIQERYQARVAGIEIPRFQQFHEDPSIPAEPRQVEAFRYTRKKWMRVRDINLVGFLWLKDFNKGVPLDPRFEVYGGKLELPTFDFSLLPRRGTLVLMPADPHFVTSISPVLVGSLELIKLCFQLETDSGPWVYERAEFPGTWKQWLLP